MGIIPSDVVCSVCSILHYMLVKQNIQGFPPSRAFMLYFLMKMKNTNTINVECSIKDVFNIIDGIKVSKDVNAMVVPGSGIVKMLAEKEGLDKVFINSGFEWREAGCSMCLAMNPDKLSPQERCASTSNRNFEGRQGKDGRTHLVSPEMAAAAAIEGHFVDVRDWK